MTPEHLDELERRGDSLLDEERFTLEMGRRLEQIERLNSLETCYGCGRDVVDTAGDLCMLCHDVQRESDGNMLR